MEEERESRKLSDHFDKKNLASKRVGYSYGRFISGRCLRIFVVVLRKRPRGGGAPNDGLKQKAGERVFQPHFDGVNPKSKVSCHL